MASLIPDTPLTKAEQEEEEMRHELKDVGLYYENMDVEEMRQLIDVLNESKNDVMKHNEDTTDSMLFSEDISSQDTSKITESSLRPLPTFSYRQDAASGTLTTQNSTLEESKSSSYKSPQASSSNSFEKNYKDNSPDSEPIYDKSSNFKKDEDYPPLSSRYKTRSSTGDGPKTRSQDSKKLSIPAAKRASMERWMLNPLEFLKEKNTTPLCQPEHLESNFEEPLSLGSEAIDLNSEEFDKLCQQMTEKLGTYSNRCMMQLEAKDKKSAPIKINIEESSKSKVPVKENSFSINNQGPSTSASPSTRNTYDRVTKRKALSTIAAATTYENDENSDDECSNTKKRKFQQGKKEDEGVKRNQENKKNKNSGKSTEVISLDDIKDVEFDNSNLHNIRKSSNDKVSNDIESIEQNSEYPRRIEPPNPAKKNFKGPKAKKKNSTQTQTQSEPEKKAMLFNKEELRKPIQELDEQIDDNDCVEITDDIKPPPTPTRVTKRLQLATNHLENARESEEQKLKAEKEKKVRREKEERLKLDERISSRLQEQEDEEGRRLENQRKFDEQSAFYNNFLNTRSRVTRATIQAEKSAEEINDLLLERDDDEPTITEIIQKHLCPICQKPYPADQIETHASGCDAYAIDSNESYNRPSTSRRVTQIYKCHLCDKFETVDGNIYEEHVTECKSKSRQLMNGGWLL